MGRLTVLALRAVLAVLLTGSPFVQTVMVALMARDLKHLEPDLAYLRTPLIVIVVLGVLTAEVVLVCVWQLLTMVKRGTVFSRASFRYVDGVIGAVVSAVARYAQAARMQAELEEVI